MPTLLLITALYPPSTAPGALRLGAFVRGFERRGWRCRVITVEAGEPHPPEATVVRHSPDSRLSRGLARVRLARLTTSFRIPDAHALWGLRAVKAGVSIGRKDRVTVVASSSLPGTAAVAGTLVARCLRVPHVADFRDPWSFNPYYTWPSWLHHRIDAVLERWVLRNSAAILCVSSDMAQAMSQRHPDIASRIHVVPNGVEEQLVRVTDPSPRAGDAFLIATSPDHYVPRQRRWPYFFHGGEGDYTTGLETLIEALRRLASPTRLRAIAAPRLDVSALQNGPVAVEEYGRLPRSEFLSLIQDADLLYLPIVENAHVHARGIAIPTRLYEYLATGRRLVVAAGEGAAKDLLASQSGVTVVPPRDVSALATAIEDARKAWVSEGRAFCPRPSVPTRERAATTLVDIVDRLVASPERRE